MENSVKSEIQFVVRKLIATYQPLKHNLSCYCCLLGHTHVAEENLPLLKATSRIYFHYRQLTVALPRCTVDMESRFIHEAERGVN